MSKRFFYYKQLAMGNKYLQTHRAGFDEGCYRQILKEHGASSKDGKFSATTMTDDQLRGALNYLRQLGYQRQAVEHMEKQAKIKKCGTQENVTDWRAKMMGKLNAQWCDLFNLGAVHNKSEQAMIAWLKNSVGIQNVSWATAQELNHAIEMLKAWQMRCGSTRVQRYLSAKNTIKQSDMPRAITRKSKYSGANYTTIAMPRSDKL